MCGLSSTGLMISIRTIMVIACLSLLYMENRKSNGNQMLFLAGCCPRLLPPTGVTGLALQLFHPLQHYQLLHSSHYRSLFCTTSFRAAVPEELCPIEYRGFFFHSSACTYVCPYVCLCVHPQPRGQSLV